MKAQIPLPTYARRMPLRPDPLAALRALCPEAAARPGCVLFETAEPGQPRAKSILLSKPALLCRVQGRRARIEAPADACLPTEALATLAERMRALGELTPTARGFALELTTQARGTLSTRAPALEVLRRFAMTFCPSRDDLQLLCAGALSFDLLDHLEPLPALASRACADIEMALPEELVLIDHQGGSVTVMACDIAGRGEYAMGRQIAETAEVLAALPDEAQPPDAAGTRELSVRLDRDDAQFGALVERAKRHIVDGDIFQVVLSRSFEAPCPRPIDAYAALRALNPSPYMFFLGGRSTLFGASPETSLRVRGGQVEIRPIAGTRGRGRGRDGRIDHDLDARIEASLRLDAKEVAEHMMLVDLARNDIARVAQVGSRRVSRLMGVDRYAAVMHLVSHVVGELRDDLDALDAYAAAMNMGTLTGAPKLRAAALLRTLEGRARGHYGGAVGYLTHDGELDTAIIIRSATVRDGLAEVRAGAGIVHDSDPLAEAHETTRKAASVLKAIAQSQGAHHG